MAVNNTGILLVVRDIETEYNKSTTTTHYAILCSKLATMEFCGWIEQTFDEIIKDYARNKLRIPSNFDYIERTILKNNHGFHYENNIRKVLMNCIGINNLENFEDCLENTLGYLTVLRSKLNTFTTSRNNAAHTYTPYGTTITYVAPSVIVAEINIITPILQKLEQEIMKL